MLLNKCFFIQLQGVPVYHQLQLEEALLRNESKNFCIVNTDLPEAIVLGISCKEQQDLFLDAVKQDAVPVIRRFSGGGSVFLDSNSIMVSWIISCPIEDTPLSPQLILDKSYHVYKPIFSKRFKIIDNDYVLKDKKIGGNGQYVQKNRFVHHTSFLWDLDIQKISKYLRHPKKQPLYRKNRSHKDFLTSLSQEFPSKQAFIHALQQRISLETEIKKTPAETFSNLLESSHRKATTLLTL